MNFKYYFQHEETGRITSRIYTLEEIENRVVQEGKENPGRRWFIFKRCKGTGIKDKNGN